MWIMRIPLPANRFSQEILPLCETRALSKVLIQMDFPAASYIPPGHYNYPHFSNVGMFILAPLLLEMNGSHFTGPEGCSAFHFK